MSQLSQILVLTFIGSIAGLLGDVAFMVNKTMARVLSRYAIALAAGVLLAVTFLDLLPEAVSLGSENTFLIILVVYVILYLVEHFFFHLHHHEQDEKKSYGSIYFVIFGDTLHNFLDGVAIATSYMISPQLGIMVAISTFLHEIPHEVVDFGILLSAKWKPKAALFANFVSAMATFVGALFAYFVAVQIEGLTVILLSLAAGLFLYVATTDFLPALAKQSHGSSWKFIFSFLLGIAIIFLGTILLPEKG